MSSNADQWIISDPHFGHKNLVKGVSNWENKSGCRDFPDIPTHNKAIVDGINDYVKEDDILRCLGDWSFGGIQNIWEFRKQLKVKDIRLILGNHDHHIENNKRLKIPVGDREDLLRLELPFVPHHDEKNHTDYYLVYAQDLFTSVNHLEEVKIRGQRMTLCHYAMRVWKGSHKGDWQLYGHSHDSLPDYTSYYAGRPDEDGLFRTMDVGFDTAYRLLGEYRPFKFQEIQKMFAGRPALKVDHHNENTDR